MVIQAHQLNEHVTVTVLPVTSTRGATQLLSITVQPDAENGLEKPSQVMVDKVLTVRRDKIGRTFRRVNANTLIEIERYLAVFLGIAK